MRFFLSSLLAVLLATAATTTAWAQGDEIGGAPGHPGDDPELREAYELALIRVRAWADGLELDTVALQANEPPIAGKKKLAEMLDLQLIFYHRGDEEERELVLGRVAEWVEQTRRPEYQDLLDCSDEDFAANSLSYMRIYILIDTFGLLEEQDLEAIRKVQSRMDADMPNRGPWQKAMFARYYQQLGLELPEILVGIGLEEGLVAGRLPLARYELRNAYNLMHEGFVASEYGSRHDQELFDAEDLVYLQSILIPLQRFAVDKRGFDLMGETVSSNSYLGFTQDPSYRAAVEVMLAGQNENGSWGNYEKHREEFGDLIEVHAYLHTSMVCAQALYDCFERERAH
jgi:hypothetical protein